MDEVSADEATVVDVAPPAELIARSSAPPRPPESIGHYPVQGILGQGAMGIVYLARDPRLMRPVAIKAMPERLADDPLKLSRFKREARALAALNHPHIATVHALEQIERRLYLVLEYIEGVTLGRRLAEAPMGIDEAVPVIMQVADGLQAAHARGIVHRDLKPGNVMIRPDGRVKLLDFGIAKNLEGTQEISVDATLDTWSTLSTLDGALVGTPAYMSPEQVRGLPVSPQTDLWGLGCMLFECLTGQRPFQSGSLEETLRAVCLRDPDWSLLPPELPASLRQLVVSCLTRQPQGRPHSARAVKATLSSVASELSSASLPAPVPGATHNLPADLQPCVGREVELTRLQDALIGRRLTTLTGVGGTGKTRLALEAARRRLDAHDPDVADGVWLVELAPLAEPGLLVRHLGATLGFEERPGESYETNLARWLADRHLLVVLDNCEHLLEAAADLCAWLLEQAPGVQVLATSRQRLTVPGELAIPVAPLPVPPARTDVERLMSHGAVDLFVRRAREARPGFALTRANASAVGRICRAVDGLPLALELAAARVRTMSVDQVARRLGQSLHLLARTEDDPVDARHQTLRATLEWSDGLLSEEERMLLRRLSVFSGGWSLSAAEAVCADEDQGGPNTGEFDMEASMELADLDALMAGPSLEPWQIADLLHSLVDKSLVVRAQGPTRESRMRCLEPVRQYARERLEAAGEATDLLDRHARHFAQVATEAEQKLIGGGLETQLSEVDRDYANLRYALARAQRAGGDPTLAWRLACGLWRYWQARGFIREGRRWLEGALKLGAGLTHPDRARLLNVSGNLASNQGDTEAARRYYAEARTQYEALGDRLRVGYVLGNLGNLELDEAHLEAAREAHQQAVEIFKAEQDAWALSLGLLNLASTLRALGELEASEAMTREGLAQARARKDDATILHGLTVLGRLCAATDRLPEATRHLTEGLTRLGTLKSMRHLISLLEATGDLVLRQDPPDSIARGAIILGAARGLREQVGTPYTPLDHTSQADLRAFALNHLDEAAFDMAIQQGIGLGDEAARVGALKALRAQGDELTL